MSIMSLTAPKNENNLHETFRTITSEAVAANEARLTKLAMRIMPATFLSKLANMQNPKPHEEAIAKHPLYMWRMSNVGFYGKGTSATLRKTIATIGRYGRAR